MTSLETLPDRFRSIEVVRIASGSARRLFECRPIAVRVRRHPNQKGVVWFWCTGLAILRRARTGSSRSQRSGCQCVACLRCPGLSPGAGDAARDCLCRASAARFSRLPGRAGRRSGRLAILAGSCSIDGRRQRGTVCRRAAHNPTAGLGHRRARPPQTIRHTLTCGPSRRTGRLFCAARQLPARTQTTGGVHIRLDVC